MYRQGRDCVITVNDQVQRFPDIVVSSDRNDLGKLLILMIYRKLDFSVILLIQITSAGMNIGVVAIGTAWTITPSQEEESIWGGKTLTKGIAL